MKNKFYLLLSILIHFNLLCFAENKGLFFTARADYGHVFQTNDFVRGVNKKNQKVNEFGAFSLGFGKQSTGKRDWEQLHNFPSYGLALYALLPENGDELGRPLALYGFLNGAFRRWEKSSFIYKIEGGFAYGWNPYDFDKNPFNIVIGSKGTVYIGLRAAYNYWLTKHLELSAGAGFTHFSNGSYKKPNKGLNLVSPHIALNYYLQPKPEFIRKSYIPPYPKNHEIFVTAGTGIKACNHEIWYLRGTPYEYDNFQYKVFTTSLAYMRQYSYKSKTGGGVSVIYDEWGGSRVDTSGEKPFTILGKQRDRFAVNLFAAHEFCIHRVSILAQVGYYVWQGMPEEKKLSLNEKVGIKYHFKSNLFAGVSLLAHNFSVADYIEWNVGYRFKWQ
ncbi:hypothetical protein FACS189434_13680 [Bacteroidia bacterium]|nr:hypothetical protein FACS189434_13680 [Bacteroidia bacterium]